MPTDPYTTEAAARLLAHQANAGRPFRFDPTRGEFGELVYVDGGEAAPYVDEDLAGASRRAMEAYYAVGTAAGRTAAALERGLDTWAELDLELVRLECWESGRRSRERRRQEAERHRRNRDAVLMLLIPVLIAAALLLALRAGAPLGSFAGG